MTILRCALAVITDRGHNVVPPSLSDLDPVEEDFLERHVAELRSQTGVGDARGRFRDTSSLSDDINSALAADGDAFVAIAARLVTQLAVAMQGVNSSSCVVALIVQDFAAERRFTLLKLDAEIEAAQLEQTADGIKLHVFDDLLPRPGDIQKGLSWPDPRSPDSDLIVLDRVRHGSAAKYFQLAFGIVASPRPKDTEDALMIELAQMSPTDAQLAVTAIGQGGPAEQVVARIRDVVPGFAPASHELVPVDGPPGYIRSSFDGTAPVKFQADGVQLSVPVSMRAAVETHREGTGYVTTIRTSTPLTPVVRFVDGG